MHESHYGKHHRTYSIQVSGIRCVNCAAKIRKVLSEGLSEPDAKIAVNIMQEKISLTVFKEQSADDALRLLTAAGFPPIGSPVPLTAADDSLRTIAFLVRPSEDAKALAAALGGQLGVVRCTTAEVEGGLRIGVTYNCEVVKGRELSDTVRRVDAEAKVVNDRIDSFSRGSKKA
jgi:copper chaperone CopZ